MPVVLLQKDDTDNVSKSFGVGEHKLGRGNTLQCTSKKVSRNHGLLRVTDGEGIFLKSTHNNPCFYKPQDSQNVSILTFGNTIKINHNDKIALSLDHGWFIVQIKDETTENNQNNETFSDNNVTIISETLKRAIEDINEEFSAKRPKTEAIAENLISESQIKLEPPEDTPSTSNNNSTNENEINIKPEPLDETTGLNLEIVGIKNEHDIKTEVLDIKIEDNKDEEIDKKTNETNEQTEEKDDKPSTSGTSKKPWRDRCWYGSSCYRKNGAHRLEFKHPGDSDFDSDTDDSRPICCYGAGCYRKNREHRKRYRHPGQTKLGAQPPPLPKRRNVKPPPDPLSQDSEELDDYDYSDPFIDDGSEDEYEPSQDIDTESEYEDSQEAEDDHKRLLKEARKFTRKRK